MPGPIIARGFPMIAGRPALPQNAMPQGPRPMPPASAIRPGLPSRVAVAQPRMPAPLTRPAPPPVYRPLAKHPPVAPPPVYRPIQPKIMAQLQPKVIAQRVFSPPAALRPGTIQCCVHCGSDKCKEGEICKFDRTYGGIFNPSATTGHVAKHKHNKKHSKRKLKESEHVLASQAIKKGIHKRTSSGIKNKRPIHSTGKSYNQNEEYTISIPYQVHRGGTSGAGGGISSTGGSTTAKGWGDLIGGLLDSNPYEAVRLACMEHLNSYFMNGNLDESVVNNLWAWIDGQVQSGRITLVEANLLKQIVLNAATRLFKYQEGIKSILNKKGGGPGKGGGKGGGGLTGGLLVSESY